MGQRSDNIQNIVLSVTTECLLNMAIGFEPEFVSGRMKKAGIM
ncbi:hypothetical protein F442_21548 [Phytophthora nicotianae P10297]|uniref:Uncharacterized protein n=3 Tax=Phytophthora nicotianae TaxID=4792 RepID=V9DWS0_PHYNI|nr:hypothetical protein F443_21692 [Phytophthora nicotianae P1569]ETM31617.1 hypothetical protein L914_20840 [Phytophthora nicotianae]ETP29276.1 hypothetical protein F442_21548 [Phytophthora nicotianae P10297]